MSENLIKEIQVLDHGFVKLRNLSGPVRRQGQHFDNILDEWVIDVPFDADDIDPAISARISFNNLDKERLREQDLKLIEYLVKHKHTTPIEMIEVWLEMKLPIFLARQFVRHRTATINEVSGRYTALPEEWYIPKLELIGFKPSKAKQGRELEHPDTLPEETYDVLTDFRFDLNKQCKLSYDKYLEYLEHGIAPELARMFLHVNHYTHWVWKQDLHNLMHFLALRLDEHAQIEARIYAQAVYDLLKMYLPETMKLFDKYRRL